MNKQKKLTQAQKGLLRGLKIFRVDEECIIVIMCFNLYHKEVYYAINYKKSFSYITQEYAL